MSDKRLFEDCYNKNYGAVRRCQRSLHHVCPDNTRLDAAYLAEWGEHWDHQLGWLINAGHTEDAAMRIVIARCIDAYNESLIW